MEKIAEILHNVGSVTTPVGALSILLTLLFLAYLAKLKYDQKQLEALPADKRAVAADEYLTRYRIDGKDFPVETRIGLVTEEMRRRFRLRLWLVSIGACVAVICFLASALAYVLAQKSAEKPTNLSGGNNPISSKKRKLDKPPDETDLPRPPSSKPGE